MNNMKELLELLHHCVSQFRKFKGFHNVNPCRKQFSKLQICFEEMVKFQNSIQD